MHMDISDVSSQCSIVSFAWSVKQKEKKIETTSMKYEVRDKTAGECHD